MSGAGAWTCSPGSSSAWSPRRLALALAAGTAAYLGAALVVPGGGGTTWPSVMLSLGLITLGHCTVRGLGGRLSGCVARRSLSPAWKLLLRTAIPAVCPTATLLLARTASADWVGLFGTFPCTMLGVLLVTSLEAGPDAAVELLRSYPIGKCSTLAFLITFALLTPAIGAVAGCAVGYLVAGCVLAGLARSDRPASCAEPVPG